MYYDQALLTIFTGSSQERLRRLEREKTCGSMDGGIKKEEGGVRISDIGSMFFSSFFRHFNNDKCAIQLFTPIVSNTH